MEPIKAAEAKDMAKNSHKPISEIYESIKGQAGMSNDKLWVLKLTEDQMQELTTNGYKIEKFNSGGYMINW